MISTSTPFDIQLVSEISLQSQTILKRNVKEQNDFYVTFFFFFSSGVNKKSTFSSVQWQIVTLGILKTNKYFKSQKVDFSSVNNSKRRNTSTCTMSR